MRKQRKSIIQQIVEGVGMGVLAITGLGGPSVVPFAQADANNFIQKEISMQVNSKSNSPAQKLTVKAHKQTPARTVVTTNGRASIGENSRFKQRMKFKKYCQPK